MEKTENDDEDDHLGEGHDDVTGMADQGQDTQDCGRSSYNKNYYDSRLRHQTLFRIWILG